MESTCTVYLGARGTGLARRLPSCCTLHFSLTPAEPLPLQQALQGRAPGQSQSKPLSLLITCYKAC